MSDLKTETREEHLSAVKQQLQGNWDQFRGRVQEAWGVLTDDDLDRAEGKVDRMIGTIKERTGETREAIAQKLEKLASW
ncbi:MAG: CsbD family protein [Rhodothermales bacterium]|nr:CsbD family protein [Rhodothermales bacterium]